MILEVDIWPLPILDYDFLFQSRFSNSDHLSTRQYSLIVKKWVTSIGLAPMEYGAHTMRRTKVALIYQKTKNLRVVQLLLGHSKLGSTVRYLGVEVYDALERSIQTNGGIKAVIHFHPEAEILRKKYFTV